MRRSEPVFAPLGRLYDPLTQLARRIHRQLGARCKTVWADERGRVFVLDAETTRAMSPYTIVGTYGERALPASIESDLRLALRERASNWILDWNLSPPRTSEHRNHEPLRNRRRKPLEPVESSGARVGVAAAG